MTVFQTILKDNDKNESSDDEDQDELNNAGNLQESSDKCVDSDDDSVDSEDQDDFMLKTTTDTILLSETKIMINYLLFHGGIEVVLTRCCLSSMY